MVSFLNNKFIESADFNNRSFRYGDGLFETMRMMRGELLFFNEHFERLFAGLNVLRIEHSRELELNYLYKMICELLERNNIPSSARIRIHVWRGGDGTYLPVSNQPSVYVEVKAVEEDEYVWREKGLTIDFSKRVRKSYDVLANVKTASALPYVMAAMEAKENSCDEMVVMNAYDKVADATSSNIFIIKDTRIITPSLRDGGVAGVFRHHLIEVLKHFNYPVSEQTLDRETIMNADEIFLTNVIKGIQPVHQCAGREFRSEITQEIFNLFNKQLLEVE